MGVRIGVVVDERHDFAFRRGESHIALFRRAHLAGRDDAHATARFEPGLGPVRQDDNFEMSVRLGGKPLEALLQDGARARTGDDDRNQRLVPKRRRNRPRSVVVQHAQPVEDRQRIERHCLDGRRLERPELVAEMDDDRRFGDARPPLMGDRQQFQVEGVGLHEHAPERLAQNAALEELHPRLRVRYREPNREPHEREVRPTHDAPVPRILHDRLWMPLGSHHDIRAFCAHFGEKAPGLGRVDVQVAIQQQHIVACRGLESRAQRRALAAVAVQQDGADHDRRPFVGVRLGDIQKCRACIVR